MLLRPFFCSTQQACLSCIFVFGTSIVLGREVAAFQAMDLCSPADAAEVVDAIRDSKILVHIVVASAAVVAVPTY